MDQLVQIPRAGNIEIRRGEHERGIFNGGADIYAGDAGVHVVDQRCARFFVVHAAELDAGNGYALEDPAVLDVFVCFAADDAGNVYAAVLTELHGRMVVLLVFLFGKGKLLLQPVEAVIYAPDDERANEHDPSLGVHDPNAVIRIVCGSAHYLTENSVFYRVACE